MTTLKALLTSLRPRQWTKNLFVFAAILFSGNVLEPQLLARVAGAFVAFCGLSGAGYILNDILDVEQDRHHPAKSSRPVAAGELSVRAAAVAAALAGAASLALSYALGRPFFWVAFTYVALQCGYSVVLKHVVILDIFAIAASFVLRAVAGAVVIGVEFSSWLIICTTLLALFLALCKRRHELVLLVEGAEGHRPVLGEYSTHLLDQMISIVTASTVVAYTLYTMADATVARVGGRSLIFTVPFVLYGIFRYLYLVHQRGSGGQPEDVLISDMPLLLDVLLWAIAVGVIIYV